MTRRAVVLLSGGLDSATTLAIARSEGFECFALSVSYGQRHSAELAAAVHMAARLGAREHRIMHVDLASIGGSALTDPAIAVPEVPAEGIPVTYVPARNTVMLSLALAWAEVLGAQAIFIGVNARDYSVAGSTRVWIRDCNGPRLLAIAEACELPAGDYETLAVDPSSLQIVWRAIVGRHKHSVAGKRCFRLVMERGQEIEVTEDHSLFTLAGPGQIRPIKGTDIRIGTPLVVPFDLASHADAWAHDLKTLDLRTGGTAECSGTRRSSVVEDNAYLTNRLHRTRIPLDFPVSDDFLRLVGLWLAEGGKDAEAANTKLAFSIGGLVGAPALLVEYFGRFGIAVHKSPQNDFDYRVDSTVANELFRRLGLFGTAKAGDKRFPSWFWQLSQRQRRLMVAGLWDGDGCMVWHGEAPIFQKSHRLIDELYQCLLLDGIFPTLRKAPHSQKRLALTRSADMSTFIELYPLWHKTKRQSLEMAAAIKGREKTTGLWKSDEIWSAVAGSDLAPGMKTRIYNDGGKYDSSVRAQRSAFAEVPSLRRIVESKLAFLRVVAIETVTHQYMYDFSVRGAENFLANGVLAHNSGYPDCRPEFIDAFERLAKLATRAGVEGTRTHIHAPLILHTKADIIRWGTELGVGYAATVSCYQPTDDGRACGVCDSCRLRRQGFEAAGIPDPTRYR